MAEITPYICAPDARAAIDWYTSVMGAVVTVEPYVMDDGRVGHAELSFDGARVMLSDAYPALDVQAPVAGAGSAVTLHLAVDDVDALTERVVAAGVGLDRGPVTEGHGRIAVFRDPAGHRWYLHQETGTH
jgi:uncharacterized glyoxalase superfamily protein PhnB